MIDSTPLGLLRNVLGMLGVGGVGCITIGGLVCIRTLMALFGCCEVWLRHGVWVRVSRRCGNISDGLNIDITE